MARTVVIVDDHATFRSFASALLVIDGFDVVGEAEDGESAIAEATRLRPEVILLDVQLPGQSGFEVAGRLIGLGVPTCIVLISSRDGSDYGEAIGASGAVGFIPKAELSGAAIRALVERVK
jgi:DNA-binding NarL/FixJ family response regulator